MSANKVDASMERGEGDSLVAMRVETLGTVRLRHYETNEVILVPTPSNDPNDPLNWYDPLSDYPRTTRP